MRPNRRAFMIGASALVATPDVSWAARALTVASDWSLATADVETDVAPRALELVHGRAPEGLSGSLYRNGPAKFRRPAGKPSGRHGHARLRHRRRSARRAGRTRRR